MEIKVTKNNVTIQEIDPVHSGEFNVNVCNFTFSDTYTNDLVKKAIFTKLKYKTSYVVTIENDTCIIPYEVLQEQGEVQLGVYAYEVDGEDLILRYSPKATRFMVGIGSYIENTEEGSIYVPASTIEEYEQQLQDLLADVEASKDEIIEEVTQAATNEALQEVDNYIDQFVKVTAEGEVISVNDSSNLPIKDFKLKGGKNLFNKDNANILNTYINDLSSTIISSNKSRSIYISCKPNTTYTISKTQATARFVVGTTASTPSNNVVCSQVIGNNTATSITITTSASDNYLCAFIYHSDDDSPLTLDQVLSYIQIEQGSTATEYEPYKTVTGDVTVNVYGANLFNANDIIGQYSSGITFTGTPDNFKVIRNGGGSNRDISFVLPKGEYTFKATFNSTGMDGLVRIVYDDDTYITFFEKYSSAPVTSQEVIKTTDSTKGIKAIRFYCYGSSYYDMQNFIVGKGNVTYIPYIEPQTQLLSLGDIQLGPTDEIAKVNNVWCVNDTPITDTTLKGQLENIPNLHTYKNITNIFSTVPTGNVEPVYEITYIQDLETRLNNIDERLDNIDARLSLLE